MRLERAVLVGAWLGIAGCHFDTGGLALQADDGGIQPPGADASVDAGMACSAADEMCLDANTLQQCKGGQLSQMACADGCVPTPTPHCKGPKPSNGVDPGMLDGASADLQTDAGVTLVFDTTNGVIFDCKTSSFVRSAGEGVVNGIGFYQIGGSGGTQGLGVFAMKSLRVRGGSQIIGIGPHALALLVQGEARFDEDLHAGGGANRCSIEAACGTQPGDFWCAGPGGFPGGLAGQAGGGVGAGAKGSGGDGNGEFESGGGGGGFGGGGARGGSDLGGAGGMSYGDNDCDPMFGGSGGGGGGTDSFSAGGIGGGGGGGVQITSMTDIKMGGMAAIETGGGGGGPGAASAGGAGGGSGGAVLLEAPAIMLDGNIAANGGGGGGGGGNMTDATPELPGAPGGLGNMAASGGGGTNAGGAGATGTTLPVGGQPTIGMLDGAGGGGGGVGRVCLRSVPGGITGTATISPAPNMAFDLVQ
jgi:hypothetical protein